MVAKDRGDTSLGDAVATTNLLGGFTGFIPSHDVGDVFRVQEAFSAGFSDILYGRKESSR